MQNKTSEVVFETSYCNILTERLLSKWLDMSQTRDDTRPIFLMRIFNVTRRWNNSETANKRSVRTFLLLSIYFIKYIFAERLKL